MDDENAAVFQASDVSSLSSNGEMGAPVVCVGHFFNAARRSTT